VSDISGDDLSDLEGPLDDASNGNDATEDEGELEGNQLKSPHGKRKASFFKSLPIQRPEKKSKKTPRVEVIYEEEIESLPTPKVSLTTW